MSVESCEECNLGQQLTSLTLQHQVSKTGIRICNYNYLHMYHVFKCMCITEPTNKEHYSANELVLKSLS